MLPKVKPFAELTAAEIDESATAFDTAAARAYVAYAASSGNKNFQGNPMPAWHELPPPIRGHWRAAVSQLVNANGVAVHPEA